MLDTSRDAGVFLSDFGLTLVWNDITTVGILEEPNQDLNLGFTVNANDYSVTFETASLVGIAAGAAITLDGKAYVVRTLTEQDDGTFTKATLKKV